MVMYPLEARLYDVIERRRDVRREFTGEPADGSVLERILGAAHAAPSVGLSQPWDFIRIEDQGIREAFWRHVQAERRAFESQLDASAAATFARIKVEGIREASVSLVVTYDETRGRRTFWVGTRSPMPGSTPSAAPSRTCGWPRPPKVGVLAGCPSTVSLSFAGCCRSRRTFVRSHGSASVRSPIYRKRQIWNGPDGGREGACPRRSTSTGGATTPNQHPGAGVVDDLRGPRRCLPRASKRP